MNICRYQMKLIVTQHISQRMTRTWRAHTNSVHKKRAFGRKLQSKFSSCGHLTTYSIYKDNIRQQNTSLHSLLDLHLSILYFGCSNFFTTQTYVNAFIHELTTTAVCVFLSILNPVLSTMTLHEPDYQHQHAHSKPNCSGTTCVTKSSWWLTHAPKLHNRAMPTLIWHYSPAECIYHLIFTQIWQYLSIKEQTTTANGLQKSANSFLFFR